MRDPRSVIVRPVVTERSTEVSDEHNAYTFIVARNANKVQIRNAVEELFDVRVAGVRTANYPGKNRRVGQNMGRTAGYKKAIVKLNEGERIDVYEGV